MMLKQHKIGLYCKRPSAKMLLEGNVKIRLANNFPELPSLGYLTHLY